MSREGNLRPITLLVILLYWLYCYILINVTLSLAEERPEEEEQGQGLQAGDAEGTAEDEDALVIEGERHEEPQHKTARQPKRKVQPVTRVYRGNNDNILYIVTSVCEL